MGAMGVVSVFGGVDTGRCRGHCCPTVAAAVLEQVGVKLIDKRDIQEERMNSSEKI